MRPSWDELFMMQAILMATRSSCLVRHVGAALVRDKRVIASAYNGAPPQIETCLQTGVCFYQNLAHKDSEKGLGYYAVLKEQRKEFCNIIHAERNAYAQCSRFGIRAEGCSLYITNFPCPGCTRDVIIPNGTAEVVVWKGYLENKLLTMDEYSVSKFWLEQAKIQVRKLELPKERLAEIFQQALNVGDRTDYEFQPPPVQP